MLLSLKEDPLYFLQHGSFSFNHDNILLTNLRSDVRITGPIGQMTCGQTIRQVSFSEQVLLTPVMQASSTTSILVPT